MIVEINPAQAKTLMDAWHANQSWIRHAAEEWWSQVERDEELRAQRIREAIESGISQHQVYNFVFWKESK